MKGSHVGRGNESSIICPLGRWHCSGSHLSWVMSGPSPTTLCCLTKLLVLLPGLQAAAQQRPAFKGGRPARSSAVVNVKTAGKCPDSPRCDAALSALNTTALRWLSMKRLPPTCCRKWRRCSIKQLLHLFFIFFTCPTAEQLKVSCVGNTSQWQQGFWIFWHTSCTLE